MDCASVDFECGIIFVQHLAMTLDFPGASEAQSIQSGMRRASRAAGWHLSAAGPSLFSAFSCDPGTKNQPPIFVSGLHSTDTNVRTEYTCPSVGPCEMVLYVRDLVPAHGGLSSDAGAESRDEITIEAAMGFPRLQDGMLTRVDGGACKGFGALQCIYKVPPNATGGLGSGLKDSLGSKSDDADSQVGRLVGSIIVTCFTALDLHASGAAPARKSCHSAPLCIKVRIEPVPIVRGVFDKIFYPSGVVPTAPRARLDVGMGSDQSVEIHVDWTPPVSRRRYASVCGSVPAQK